MICWDCGGSKELVVDGEWFECGKCDGTGEVCRDCGEPLDYCVCDGDE